MPVTKNEIRQLNKERRKAMKLDEVEEKSLAVCRILLESELYVNARCIMLYMPLGNEVDISRIAKQAYRDKKQVVFPVTEADSGVITPHFATEDTGFAKGAFSVTEPQNAKMAGIEEIDLVLVPGIAFDRGGGRIGFGKGCYDRLLKAASAVRVGVCYDFQACDKIPIEAHDIKMDFLLTEKGITECRY